MGLVCSQTCNPYCPTPDDKSKLLQQQLREQDKERDEWTRKIAEARKEQEARQEQEEKGAGSNAVDSDLKIQKLMHEKKMVFNVFCCP